jgi:hypothetical protein
MISNLVWLDGHARSQKLSDYAPFDNGNGDMKKLNQQLGTGTLLKGAPVATSSNSPFDIAPYKSDFYYYLVQK